MRWPHAAAVLVTFALLTLALAALWLPSEPRPLRVVWLALFVAAIVAGLLTRIVEPFGIASLGGLALILTATHSEHPRWLPVVATTALVFAAAALMIHWVPGFNNPRVIAEARFTPDALPFRLHFNFDKASLGLLLLAFLHPRIDRWPDWRAMFTSAAPAALATVTVLLGLSLLLGYVRFAPKFPEATGWFLWANLCFTCVAEEAIFRGFIQRRLAVYWQEKPYGTWLALGIAAMLFGLAHAAGGPTYVLLSTLAGGGYGWAYLRTGYRIEAAILTHFVVNATHFLLFSYPALAPHK
ncbi:MAG TPA: CPBP family intramembrane glutamic endopeptidase [Opitutaceae bacterium]